jgi:predicted NUDIX family NTP pyrophosphohydrolase
MHQQMQVSAGLLMFRRSGSDLELFLVHPGGPFWAKKDAGAWSIPKGLVDQNEDKLAAAQREFTEETSLVASGPFIDLGMVRLKSGKLVHAWAFAGDCNPSEIRSNTFEIEWPPRSKRMKEFPEIDQARFFSVREARQRINQSQVPFIDRLMQTVTTENS